MVRKGRAAGSMLQVLPANRDGRRTKNKARLRGLFLFVLTWFSPELLACQDRGSHPSAFLACAAKKPP